MSYVELGRVMKVQFVCLAKVEVEKEDERENFVHLSLSQAAPSTTYLWTLQLRKLFKEIKKA